MTWSRLKARLANWLASYDKWLQQNGLDKPCRSCIPREHPKQVQDKQEQ